MLPEGFRNRIRNVAVLVEFAARTLATAARAIETHRTERQPIRGRLEIALKTAWAALGRLGFALVAQIVFGITAHQLALVAPNRAFDLGNSVGVISFY